MNSFFKSLIICSLCLPVTTFAAKLDIDTDNNKATDITAGGTNAKTAATARDNLGVTGCFANSTAFNDCFALDWPAGFDTAGDYTVTGAWDFTGATVTGISGTGGATAINDLTDVDTTGKATGKVLKFDASGNLVVGDDNEGSGSFSYPGAGVPKSTGTAWDTSYTVGTGASNLVQLDSSSRLPAVSGALLTDTFTGTLISGQTTHKGAIQAIATELDNAVEITAGTGITISSGSVSVTANTYQAYDADWLGITANGASLVSAANYAAMKTLLDIDDIQTLTGIAAGTAHLGTFTGSTIADSSTIKVGMQALETAVEGKQAALTLGTGISTFLATPSSSNLASTVTGETGSGALVFGTSPTIATPNIAGANYPVSASTSTATGNINIDGVSADHYYFNNGPSAATYTPVITSPPASGKERAIILTVGGGTGVITMTWTNVSFIGTAGAATTTASKYSHYGCFIPSSGNAKCKIIAEASDN